MIIPSFRLYHFAVKTDMEIHVGAYLFSFWTGLAVIFYLVNHVAIWG